MVTKRETVHIMIAVALLTLIISFNDLIHARWYALGPALLYALLIIVVAVAAKKIAALMLDASVEHEIWTFSRYGFKPDAHLKNALPAGVVVPSLVTLLTAGTLRAMTFLTYETSALKQRAAKRFGFYSFTEMTDWHTALVGAAGIVGVFLLAVASYFIPVLTGLPSLAVYYALWNLIPFSKLDGAQIFFGSRVLYTALLLIALVMTLATVAIV